MVNDTVKSEKKCTENNNIGEKSRSNSISKCEKCVNNENSGKNDESSDDLSTRYNAEWSDQHEKILVEWADKALCYRWLHFASHKTYSFKNRWFTVPVIVMSTLTGTANFAQERIPEDYQAMYSVIVGSINILAGIITTIQQFLKISELNESHRVSSISWDKFYRNIKLELAKSREERMPAFQMLKISKEEFDRLMEVSPSIENKILKKFNYTFSGGPIVDENKLNNKQIKFIELNKPEICDVLESTQNYVYKESKESIAKNKTKNIVNFVKENNEFKRKSIVVTDFIKNFNGEYKREPTLTEIHDNLNDNVSNDIINTVINNNKNGSNNV